MALRHPAFAVLTLAAASALVAIPSVGRADPAAAGDAKPYVGQVAADDVLVRSGPSEGFYATQKLNKGDRVTVVGVRGGAGEWLKIVPPDGSFCYVAQAYVERSTGSDGVGRVTKPELNVRAGSLLNGSKKTRLMTLNTDDKVQIVGVDDEYFKIAPPPGAYLYVQRSLVTAVPDAAPPAIPLAAQANEREPMASDPVPAARPAAAPAVVSAPVAPPPPPAVPVTANTPMVPAVPTPPAAPPVTPPPAVATAVAPATRPAAADDAAVAASAHVAADATTRPTAVAVAVARPATTRPAVASPRQRFDSAEVEFARVTKLPLEKQSLDGLHARYATLANNAGLPASLRAVAQNRAAALAVRIDVRKQLADANASAVAAADRQKAAAAEQDELAQRVKAQQVVTYAAVGTLRVSSLQQSGPTLYRLTDPATGHTLIYVRSNDAKLGGLLNQFVGVRGPVVREADVDLQYVTATDVDPVDVNSVNRGVNAEFVPPSLIARSAGQAAAAN